ncbi:hypothetical protein MP228_003748 [Amoeboaphelidium protococcarum]|nr:hypothetical protein MP228_003748 [Amoeboaphelidium protococcarum]
MNNRRQYLNQSNENLVGSSNGSPPPPRRQYYQQQQLNGSGSSSQESIPMSQRQYSDERLYRSNQSSSDQLPAPPPAIMAYQQPGRDRSNSNRSRPSDLDDHGRRSPGVARPRRQDHTAMQVDEYGFQQQQQQQVPQNVSRKPLTYQHVNSDYGNNGYMSDQSSDVRSRDQSTNSVIVRKKTVRKIELFRGNLVLNCPIPDALLNFINVKQEEEFNVMRYSAVTCNIPDSFMAQNYTLRPHLYGRETVMFVCLTLYNEGPELVSRSISSLIKNIQYLCARDRSRTWGPEGWKKVVLCIVADGRNKIHKETLKLLGLMGLYQEGIMKDHVMVPQNYPSMQDKYKTSSSHHSSHENTGKVSAHVFEYTCQVTVDELGRVKKSGVPVQMMFVLKEENKKKLNSHRWFFNAFCPIFNPEVCVLIDAGTKPSTSSLYHLWKSFETDPNLGGACGEIKAELGKGCVKVFNPLVGAQNFEYKMSNILDKPLESVFGYISVLPGAFSAYRYSALLNDMPGHGPLASYFEGEKLHDGSANIFKANMYLAEDRVLCFELVAKARCAWKLKYVKSASATTDVPEGIPEFISQRRRWLNGSLFAMFYSIGHWFKIWNTGHSFAQKWLFQLQMLYNIINVIFTWFGISLFYLTFFYLSQNVINGNDPFVINGQRFGDYVFQIVRQIYIATIIMIVIASLGNRPQGSRGIYAFTIVLFAFIMALMIFLLGWTIGKAIDQTFQQITAQNPNLNGAQAFSQALVTSATFRDIFITVVASYGLYLIISLLHGDPWHMFTSFIQYTFLSPTFINVLPIYAFCNISDVSWGTKGDNKPAKLGSANMSKTGDDGKGGQSVDVELPFENIADKGALNSVYDQWLRHFEQKARMGDVPEEEPKRDVATKLEDWYKTFRTRIVLAWLFSNALLIAVLTNEQLSVKLGGTNADSNPFLAVMFWSFLGLTAIRFIGSCIYLIKYAQERACRCC